MRQWGPLWRPLNWPRLPHRSTRALSSRDLGDFKQMSNCIYIWPVPTMCCQGLGLCDLAHDVVFALASVSLSLSCAGRCIRASF